jgi:peptidyl-prolyl cis-trans isomerase C
MKKIAGIIALLIISFTGIAQKKPISQVKTDIEKSGNSPLYVKDVLKKKFRLDTVAVLRTSNFRGLPDSLAYHGKTGKVYGPYDKNKILVQILAKLPNKFNHVGQIFLDASVFTRHFADSLADNIMSRIKEGTTTFEEMAQTYSMGGEAATKGDLGWVATGGMIPEIEQEIGKRKKGELFRVWTSNGLHIIRKTDNPKEDTGYALMMVIFL